MAGLPGSLAVLVELQQHGGKVGEGDLVVMDVLLGQVLLEELEDCLPVESSHVCEAQIGHLEHLLAWILRVVCHLEVGGEAVHILEGEGEGGHKCEGGYHVEASLPKLVCGDQRQRLEDGHIFDPREVSGSLQCLGCQDWLLLALLLKSLDCTTGC